MSLWVSTTSFFTTYCFLNTSVSVRPLRESRSEIGTGDAAEISPTPLDIASSPEMGRKMLIEANSQVQGKNGYLPERHSTPTIPRNRS